MKLKDKIAFVTGSTRGIGYQIARLFLQEGAKVIVCGSREETVQQAARQLEKELSLPEDRIYPIALNMKNKEEIRSRVKEVIAKWGKIDILVNNAGITSQKNLVDSTDEEFQEMFDVNFFGPVCLTREVVSYMKEYGGSIINTSSMVGVNGGRGQAAYATSKAAINGLTKSLAKELGEYKIRVNAVAPGVVGTEMVEEHVTAEMKQILIGMTPLKRMATPNDLAPIYLYLASDDSSFTTGTIIQVDGGLIM